MDAGSLTDFLSEDPSERFQEAEMAFISREVLKALMFLHDSNRIHRDVKSDNILINMHGEVKLADFARSIQLDHRDDKRASIVGTPYWSKPNNF